MPKKKPKRRLSKVKLDQVALVGDPAVPEAEFALVKRKAQMSDEQSTEDIDEVEVDLAKIAEQVAANLAESLPDLVSNAVQTELKKLNVEAPAAEVLTEKAEEESLSQEEIAESKTALEEAEDVLVKQTEEKKAAEDAEVAEILKAIQSVDSKFAEVESKFDTGANDIYRQLAKARGKVMDDEIGLKEEETEEVAT